MHDLKKKQHAMVEAAQRWWALLIFATAMAMSLIAGSMFILVVGLLGYAALSVAPAFDAGFVRELERAEAREAARLPSPDELRDLSAKEAIRGVLRGRDDLHHALRQTPDWLRTQVAPTWASSMRLEELAARLARHADEIYRHLEANSADSLRQELLILGERRRAASDRAALEYEAASALRVQQLETIVQLQAEREHALAALARIDASLRGVRTRHVRLFTLAHLGDREIAAYIGDEVERIHATLALAEAAVAAVDEPSALQPASPRELPPPTSSLPVV